MLLRSGGVTAHFDISCRQRGRGRHLLRSQVFHQKSMDRRGPAGASFYSHSSAGSHRHQGTFLRLLQHRQGRRSGPDWVKRQIGLSSDNVPKNGYFKFFHISLVCALSFVKQPVIYALYTFLCFVAQSVLYSMCSLLCAESADEAGKRGLLLSQLRASARAQLFRNLKQQNSKPCYGPQQNSKPHRLLLLSYSTTIRHLCHFFLTSVTINITPTISPSPCISTFATLYSAQLQLMFRVLFIASIMNEICFHSKE